MRIYSARTALLSMLKLNWVLTTLLFYVWTNLAVNIRSQTVNSIVYYHRSFGNSTSASNNGRKSRPLDLKDSKNARSASTSVLSKILKRNCSDAATRIRVAQLHVVTARKQSVCFQPRTYVCSPCHRTIYLRAAKVRILCLFKA